MGHDAGQDVAGLKLVEVFGLAHPLGLGPGEPVEGLSVFVGVDALNDEAGGATHPRQHGDVPHAAGVGPVGALSEGHHAAGHRGPQLGGAQAGSIAVVVFGTKRLHHLSFLFL